MCYIDNRDVRKLNKARFEFHKRRTTLMSLRAPAWRVGQGEASVCLRPIVFNEIGYHVDTSQRTI